MAKDTKQRRAFLGEAAGLWPMAKGSLSQVRRRCMRATCPACARGDKHPAIWRIQNIFCENAHRLYHWAQDPSIPADNNLAERDLRPLVIARKTSFGSQSTDGAHTREVLMTVLHTLKKRRDNPAAALQDTLDQLARNPAFDPYPILFPSQRPPRRRTTT